MEPPLKTLLQVHLASDSSAALHLPYTLNSLNAECFEPSSHTTKWTIRINSLLHSKDAGARWAGLCLAQKTAVLSRNILMECAQNWIGVCLPMLSRNEPAPTMKAVVRLIASVFIETHGIAEFQRQVTVPNLPKFTIALLGLIEKCEDIELKVTIISTCARLIPMYPTLHKASHTALYNLCLRILNGSAPHPTNAHMLGTTSRLFSVLPLTGGKVGGVNLWRKFVDETVEFGWNAFYALRSTFAANGQPQSSISIEEAVVQVPLNLDRLQCCSVVLCDLLRSPCQRAVQLPLGALIRFIGEMLRYTKDDPEASQCDPSVRILEVSIIPEIWKLACDILAGLAACAGTYMLPHFTWILSSIVFHLEQKLPSSQRLYLFKAADALFRHSPPVDAPMLLSRLARAILPIPATIIDRDSSTQPEKTVASTSYDTKGKKRARAFEGDEIFKLSGTVICPSKDDELALLAALDLLQILLRNDSLSPSLQSLCSRVILSILITLPQLPPATLSPNLTLHKRVHQKVQTIAMEISAGTSSVLSKGLGLVCRLDTGEDAEISQQLELLLHPRVPPLLRSLPHVENMALFKAEETQEEIELRQELGLQMKGAPTSATALPETSLAPQQAAVEEDVRMTDVNELIPATQTQSTFVEPNIHPENSVAKPVDKPPFKGLIPMFPPTTIEPTLSAVSSIEPLSNSKQKAPIPGSSTGESLATQPRTTTTGNVASEEDDDEEMPSINMESDSEEDEDN